MAKIDKVFDWLGLTDRLHYDYADKDANTMNKIKYMLDRSNIMFKWHDLPDSIPESELERLLQTNGFAIVCRIKGELYAVSGGLGGVTDVYGRPTQAVVSVPYLQYNDTLDIGKDCIIIKSDTSASGLLPMYSMYCNMLTESDITMRMALVNKRVQFIISAQDDSTFESAKKFLTDLESGKMGAIMDECFKQGLSVSPATTNSTNQFADLVEFHQYIKSLMYNDIGLGANWNAKRERLTANEVEQNSDNLYPLVDDMLANRRTAVDQINQMFGTNITVELNSSWDYRIYNGQSIHNTEDEINLTDLEQTETPEDEEQTETPEEQTETPEEQTETPEDEDQTETPEDEDQTETPEDEDQTETPEDEDQTETPEETTENEYTKRH